MYLEITTEEVKKRLEQGESLYLIDVREEFEFNEGHIPEAKLIPLGKLPTYLKQIEKDKEYIIVCRRGNRSEDATEYMHELGFTRTKNMVGGMLAWTGQVETVK